MATDTQDLKTLKIQVKDLYKKLSFHEKQASTLESLLLKHITNNHKQIKKNEESIAKLLGFLKARK